MRVVSGGLSVNSKVNEYTPHGQLWIDDGVDRRVIRYRFTETEYDQQMGLHAYRVGQSQ